MRTPSLVLVSLSIGGFLVAAPLVRAADPAKPSEPAAAPAKPADPAAAPAKPTAGAAPTKVVGPPETAWKDMTGPQKGHYMKEVVLPKMKPVFQGFDADEFKKFGCPTCHGDKAKVRKFKMPNPDLPVLPGSQAGFATLMQKKPEMMKFMANTVKPEMAKLLGVPEFDPKKAEAGGFGCTGCHTAKKE